MQEPDIMLTDWALNKTTGQTVSVSADDLLNQHLLIVGQTRSGKSTSMVALLMALQHKSQTAIILDPTGEYVNLPNVVVGQLGGNAFLDYTALTAPELAQLAGITDHEAIETLGAAIVSLRIMKNVVRKQGLYVKMNRLWSDHEDALARLHAYPRPYNGALLPEQLLAECVKPLAGAAANFDVIGQQPDFEKQTRLYPAVVKLRQWLSNPVYQRLLRLPMTDQMKKRLPKTRYDVGYLMRLFAAMKADHRHLVIDLSALAGDLRTGRLIVSLLAARLLRLKQTMRQSVPVVLTIDEAHRYLSQSTEMADDGLSRLAREGRKVGAYLMLTTQSPLDLPQQLVGEFGQLMIHRLTTGAELALLLANPEVIAEIAQQKVGEATLAGTHFREPVPLKISPANVVHETASPRFH
ncbi:ATP-binding protein [Furfurilactobacillus entadae]|uniref:ATP-binding protein n=1 Tax=Furfurilactobacillus entadae TaxID=2922307 RepID=UPI0035EE97F2